MSIGAKVMRALSSVLSISDEQAMWRVQTQDDHRAFALLVERWQGPILELCTRMTGDPHAGEDLKQAAFARLYEKRGQYRASARFSTYLWRVALNLCYDELRRIKRRSEWPLDENASESEANRPALNSEVLSPHEQAVQEEESALVREALLDLPEHYRTVIVLRHYENMKLREIAEVLEIPAGTVNSRMAEALTQLTSALERRLNTAPARDLAAAKIPKPKTMAVV